MTGCEVVVGADGSEPSLTAVRWAAQEAARRRAWLRVVVAEEVEGTGKPVADDAVAAVRAVEPGLVANGTTVLGSAAQALVETGQRAGLLVVGGRGYGGFAAALVGATSLHVVMYAPCPVAVVRGLADGSGPVVVGVDGSPYAEHALDLAYQEAAVLRCALVVVGAFESAAESRVRAAVRTSVATRADRYPGVPVEQVVEPGNPAEILVRRSRGAQLVVVGTRGRGGFPGLLLGSVALRLVHHAECPVLVARVPDPRLGTEPGAP